MYNCPFCYISKIILSQEIKEEMAAGKDQQQKLQILEAAKTAFQQHGYLKTSMDDIARQAEKSRTTVYKYYKNKDQVFEDYLLSEINEIVSTADQAIPASASLEAKLISYNFRKIEAIRAKLEPYKRLISGDIESTRHYTFFREQFSLAEKVVMKRVFQEGIDQKVIAYIPETELDFLISVITLALRGIEQEAFLSEEDVRLNERLEWLVGIMVRGLK